MWSFNNFADKTAIITEEGNKITYDKLELESTQLAVKVGKRCLVFILCKNTKGSLLGYSSCLNNNIVPLLLNADIDSEMLGFLIDVYKPDFLWIPMETEVSFSDCKAVYKTWDYVLLKTKNNNVYPLNDDLALLLTTSGSTGSPKLVRQSYKNIKANSESIVKYLDLGSSECPITTMPMSYTYGLSIINSHFQVGASIILTQKTLMEKEFWKQFKDYGATSFGGVPYIYEMLDKLRFYRMDLPTLRTMTQAGGKLSPELHKKLAEYALQTGRHFIVMYGQTEATARMSYLPHEKSLEKHGSMGIAIPGGAFCLIDIDGSEIADSDVVGELVYKGDNVTLGYAETGADLSRGDDLGGILVTGDMAKRDDEGFYYIVGRKKRFLKIFGNRINLDETERLIKKTFPGLDCACSGIDDQMAIHITSEESMDDVKSFLSIKTGLNQSAFSMTFVSKIPRNESGKVLYSNLEVRDGLC